MADVTVTKTTIAALNTGQTKTWNAGTDTVASTAQVFTITPTAADGKLLIEIKDEPTQAVGKYSYAFSAGDLFGSKAISGTGGNTAAAASTHSIQIDTARVLQSDGTIDLTITPSDSKMVLSTHHISVAATQLI